MYWKIKIRNTDILYSKYIREKAGNKCEYCNKSGEYFKLENSHYFSRRHENLRFDDDNCSCLCFKCHQKLGHSGEKEKKEYTDFMIRKIGKKRFDLLRLRSTMIKKRDDKMDLLIIKEKIKELQNNPPKTIF